MEKTNLIDEIRKILDNAYRQTNDLPNSVRITFPETVYILFGKYAVKNGEDGKNNRDDKLNLKENLLARMEKIDSVSGRHLNLSDIDAFIWNNCDPERNFFNRLYEIVKIHRRPIDKIDAFDYDSLYYDVTKFCSAINPYPLSYYKYYNENDYDEEFYTDDEDLDYIDKTMLKQLLMLFVHNAYCCLKTPVSSAGYTLFDENTCSHLIVKAPFSPHLGNYVYKNKPVGIETAYLINKTVHDYDDLLSLIRPDYTFWNSFSKWCKDKNSYFYNLNPFADYEPFEWLCSILTANTMLIIDIPIQNTDFEWIEKLPCKILYIVHENEMLRQSKLPLITTEKILPGIISTFTNDEEELSLLTNLCAQIGFHIDTCRLIHMYYQSYEKEKSGKGKELLKQLAYAETLEQSASSFDAYDIKPVSIVINKDKSARKLQNALYLLYSKCLIPEECELLRILCHMQETFPDTRLDNVCHILGLSASYEKMVSLGWINNDINTAPKVLAAALTYKSNMSNKCYCFHLNMLSKVCFLILGYTNHRMDKCLFRQLIQTFHEENIDYLTERSKKSVEVINKSYIKELEKKYKSRILPEDYLETDLNYFRENGYLSNADEKEKNDPVTEFEFLNKTVLTKFYYAAMIFCYEYGLKELAKHLYNGITDNPAILGFNNARTKIKNNEEYQVFCRCYKILFHSKEDRERTASLLQTIGKYSKEKNPALIKPVFRIFLRHSLIAMQKALFWHLRYPYCQDTTNTYSFLIKTAKTYLEKILKQILPPKVIKTYYTEEASLDCHICILLRFCNQAKHHLAIESPNIYYKIHRFIYKGIQFKYDRSQLMIVSQRIAEYNSLGDLPEITQKLLYLLSI